MAQLSPLWASLSHLKARAWNFSMIPTPLWEREPLKSSENWAHPGRAITHRHWGALPHSVREQGLQWSSSLCDLAL